jgi:hypothetical protein
MLFHATHRHTHETCSAHKPESQALFGKVLASADELGVKIIGSYVDAPGHAVYMIIEADTALQIAQFFDPILELGDTEIRPVADAMALLQQMEKQAD